MRNKADLQKHTLNLYAGDADELRTLYPNNDWSEIVRTLVRQHIEKVKAAAPKPEIDVKV